MREYTLKNPFSEPALPAGRQAAEPAEPFAAEGPGRRVLTVTELTRQIQGLFQEAFPYGIWVGGEISDPKVYPSGHLWFDLKDSQSVLKAVMWRDDARRMKFQPEQGLQVICFGKIDFYAPRGEVKFVARSIEPKGLGALQLAFEQMKERLQKEGLFDESRKRPLPAFPERIGIVTSPRGAAIDDMLRVFSGQRFLPAILLYPSRVQGAEAASQIARGIAALNGREDLDCLIVGRGGGSLEDLWSFNEETVARAITASRLPVISAVGHEKDVTISDLVADVRAPTPTRAAEMVMAQRRNFLDRFAAALENPAFIHPEEWVEEARERLEEFQAELVESLRRPLLDQSHRLRILHGDLLACSPQNLILHQSERLHGLSQTLQAGMIHSLEQGAARFLNATGRLQALSPLAVLSRGYSITFDSQGKILKEAQSVQSGELIQTRLHRGRITSRVESKQEV